MMNQYFTIFSPLKLFGILGLTILFTCQPFHIHAKKTSDNQQSLINQLLDSAFNSYVDQDYASALLNFQKVLQINPNEETAMKGVRQCRKHLGKRFKEQKKLLKQVRKLMKKNKWVEATDSLVRILEKHSDFAAAINLKKEMESTLQNKINKAPASSHKRTLYQGMYWYFLGQYLQAIQAWESVVKIVPNAVKLKIYINRAKQNLDEKDRIETLQNGQKKAQKAMDDSDYDLAILLWEKLLHFDPQNDAGIEGLRNARELTERHSKRSLIGEAYDLGVSYFEAGQYAQSLEQWQKIIRLSPDNEVAIDYIGKIQAKGVVNSTAPNSSQNQEKEVPEGLEIDISDKKNTKAPIYEEGVLLLRTKKIRKAVEYFANYVMEHPQDMDALEWSKNALIQQKERSDEYYRRGLVAYAQGNQEDAIKEWQKAIDILPTHESTLKALKKVQVSK